MIFEKISHHHPRFYYRNKARKIRSKQISGSISHPAYIPTEQDEQIKEFI